MKSAYRYLFWLLAGLLLLVIIWQPWRPEKPEDAMWPADLSRLEADLTFDQIRYTRNTGNETQWILESRTARLYEDKDVLKLRGVFVRFHPSSGSEVTVGSDSGIYRIKAGTISLQGNVVVNTPDGKMLSSDSLWFDPDSGKIKTSDDVVIRGENLILSGKGLEYDIRSGKLTVTEQTTVLPGLGETGAEIKTE